MTENELALIELKNALQKLQNGPLASVFFPQDTCKLEEFQELIPFEDRLKDVFKDMVYIEYPEYARWAILCNGFLEDVNYTLVWNICNEGKIIKMTAIPHDVHLKEDLSENEILEKVNTVNASIKQNCDGVCAVYNNASNSIYFKRSFLLIPSDEYIKKDLFSNSWMGVSRHRKQLLENLYEIN